MLSVKKFDSTLASPLNMMPSSGIKISCSPSPFYICGTWSRPQVNIHSPCAWAVPSGRNLTHRCVLLLFHNHRTVVYFFLITSQSVQSYCVCSVLTCKGPGGKLDRVLVSAVLNFIISTVESPVG